MYIYIDIPCKNVEKSVCKWHEPISVCVYINKYIHIYMYIYILEQGSSPDQRIAMKTYTECILQHCCIWLCWVQHAKSWNERTAEAQQGFCFNATSKLCLNAYNLKKRDNIDHTPCIPADWNVAGTYVIQVSKKLPACYLQNVRHSMYTHSMCQNRERVAKKRMSAVSKKLKFSKK